MNTSSKLLINESPLTVLPSLVKLVGLERAIMLQQIQYLLQQKNTGRILEDDGEKYIWSTAQEFKDNYFPFWEADTIRKHLKQLEKEGYLITRKPRAASRDHTKFYRIDYVTLNEKIGVEEPTAPVEIPEEIPSAAGDKVDESEPALYSESNRKIIRIEPEYNAGSDSEYNAGSLKETKTSTKTSGGGGGSCSFPADANKSRPPTAAESLPKEETRVEYLLRKQIEFPQFDVKKIYQDFRRKCGSLKYPQLKDSQRSFDKWLKTQDTEFEAEKLTNPAFDEAAFFAKKYGGKINAA